MSDKKEIATLSIKISVDSTDLDKLEAQLRRIEGLMVSTGLKQPTSVGFSADMFFVTNGQVFIDEALIPSAKIQGIAIDDALRQAVKEGAKKGAEQARFEITTGVNDNREQVSAEMILKSSAKIAETGKAISREQSEFEKFKRQVDARFEETRSQLTSIESTSAASEQLAAQHISGLKRQIATVSESLASLKESADSSAEAVRNTQEAISEAIKKAVIEDLARGGPLCRALR